MYTQDLRTGTDYEYEHALDTLMYVELLKAPDTFDIEFDVSHTMIEAVQNSEMDIEEKLIGKALSS